MSLPSILIIGQGLAGSVLGWTLQQANCSVHIVDEGHAGSASQIAAGLVNPITGRRLVKSWMIDEFIQSARPFYKNLEHQLRIPLFFEMDILRYFTDAGQENLWYMKYDESPYKPYLDKDTFKTSVNGQETTVGRAQNGFRVDVPRMIAALRQRWIEEGHLTEAKFDFADLTIQPNHVQWRGKTFDYVISCRGYRDQDNPYFDTLPWQPSAGQILRLDSVEPLLQTVIKRKFLFIPLSEQQMWVGSINTWTDQPNLTSKAYEDLLAQTTEVFDHKWINIDQQCAIRPSVKGRRPFIGSAETTDRIWLFNGFGSKGTSMVPYWAEHLTQVICNNILLDPTVDILRFN